MIKSVTDNSTYLELYRNIASRLALASGIEREITDTLLAIQADIACYSERLAELDSYSTAIDYLDNFGGIYE